ncbi:hypothetical protein LCGC14_2805480, partial [marine sediment metagenome]
MTNRLLLIVTLCASLTAGARAELLSESWGAKGKLTHPGTVRVVAGKAPRVIFDLSAIPRGAKVHHASLQVRCSQPREPIELVRATVAAAGKPAAAAKPLALEGPLFNSF